ncbi:hypothetical protein KIL84_015868 [Mauremys mutica]|uniref:Uncharacterized protein n=1 Tax=Mauremys mutica TaxID=74926 RepID=A0A9D4ASA9_9SAUR|nr:hypothetical protein KIL84_015868 [Mauremys mutica]
MTSYLIVQDLRLPAAAVRSPRFRNKTHYATQTSELIFAQPLSLTRSWHTIETPELQPGLAWQPRDCWPRTSRQACYFRIGALGVCDSQEQQPDLMGVEHPQRAIQ